MSGWTNLTIHASDDEANERIDQELRDEYTGKRPYTATGWADRTVKVGRGAKHYRAAREFAEKFPEAEYIVVVSANDTSDSGDGTLFRVTLSADGSEDERFNEHPIKKIDEKSGYEGASGRDVTGYFRDEHGIIGHASMGA